MSQSKLQIQAVLDAAKPPLTIALTLRPPAGWVSQMVSLRLGGLELLHAPASSGQQARVRIDLAALRRPEDYALHLRVEAGNGVPNEAESDLRGEFFDALRISPGDFLDKVQLHHSRFRSQHLLELAAHGFYLRHPEAEFVLRAAALTILGHRYLEKPPDSLKPAEQERVAWLLGEARRVSQEGAVLIQQAEADGAPVDWRHVRWTVSLATVAAHLSLYEESYEEALSFLDLATRHTHLVGYAKVSALNFVICAFAEGAIAHLLGRHDLARTALTRGVEAVKPIVQAQNLMENVWVLGDLQNVLRAARQCYIALLRLRILEAQVSPPVIEDTMQIDTGEVISPLHRIMLSGRIPALARHLAAHGGR
ncbi:hypothetical protein [Roseomonas xinghualingensis]|uniref:hypothetical protein n=1 Tax=Roseomonas xinghualingensis TaxID=2986475 RepID=UPI0021F1077A|nr:hypothetical protein [Roseomonas sp. SXEYE001]MCV4207825.1 hypothetical protein [Roseomonas sp. SXEYE001]